MGRFVFRYLAQTLFVLSPFIAPLVLNQVGLQPLITDLFGTPTPPPEEGRAAVSFAFLVIVFIYEALDLYLPRESRRKFRNRYLTEQFQEVRPQLHKDVRINIMYARRRWFLLWLMRIFEWTANDGFKAGRDRDLGIRLFEWQGVCGRALRREEITWVDLRDPVHQWDEMRWYQKYFFWNRFRLPFWQLKKTRDVRAILSVPMFRQTHPNPNPKWKPVGVVNIDAISPEGADWLTANHAQWRDYFLELGSVIAELD